MTVSIKFMVQAQLTWTSVEVSNFVHSLVRIVLFNLLRCPLDSTCGSRNFVQLFEQCNLALFRSNKRG